MSILLDYHPSGSNNWCCLYLLVISSQESNYLVSVIRKTKYRRLVVPVGYVVIKTYLLFGVILIWEWFLLVVWD